MGILTDFRPFQSFSSRHMDQSELKRLVRWMRRNGVSELKHEDIHIKLESKAPKAIRAPAITEPTDPIPEHPEARMPSDSDMLMWSTGSYDLITETRKDDTPRN